MLREKRSAMAAIIPQFIGEESAKFMGWQRIHSGESFALYQITDATHPSFGSTVTVNTLRELGLHVPHGTVEKQ